MSVTSESEVGWEDMTIDTLAELERTGIEVMAGQSAMTFVSSSILLH